MMPLRTVTVSSWSMPRKAPLQLAAVMFAKDTVRFFTPLPFSR